MADSALNTSTLAVRTSLLADIPTATVSELVNISRSLKGLNLWNDSAIETAVNDRSITLLSGATASEIIKISAAIKYMMGPALGGSNTITSLNTVTSDLIPDADVTYDLGSSSKKFNDLFLSGNTINLGGQTISATGSGLQMAELKVGSGVNSVKLNVSSGGKLTKQGTDSSGNVGAISANDNSPKFVTNFSDMAAIANPVTGEQVLVTSTNKLFIYTGVGWYLIASMVNESPTAITGVNASYSLEGGTADTVITAISSDPEGFGLTWSSNVTSGSLNGCTVSNVDNVFTVSPHPTNEANFTLTISATDGAGTATFDSVFDLQVYASPGGKLFTSNTTWTAPADVTLVHVVAVGAGAEAGSTAGGGGGLGWKNNITVVPGQNYTVVVGQGGQNKSNEHSYFIDQSTVMGRGGASSSGGTWVGDGGGNGGNGVGGGTYANTGSGGAGGYTGNGGSGTNGSTALVQPDANSGAAGGSSYNHGGYSTGGAGVGVYGKGATGVTGAGGIHPQYHPNPTSAGTGGSGGGNPSSSYGHTNAANYGGGGGGGGSGAGGGNSGYGAVRIVWGGGPGTRAFPSTNVDLAYSNTGTGE